MKKSAPWPKQMRCRQWERINVVGGCIRVWQKESNSWIPIKSFVEVGSREHRSRGRSSFREGIKSVNASEIRCREVTASKIWICQNLVTETLKNKNYLVASSEWGLAIDTHDSRRKIKEKQLLWRFKWQDRIMENEETPGLWKKRQKQTISL